MKFAIALIAGVALLASVHAAPAAENDPYISESLRDIIRAIRGRVQIKLDELQKRRQELHEQLKKATGEAREQVRQSLENITTEIQGLVKNLLDAIKRAVKKDDQLYFKDAIVGKIREYREIAKQILQQVTEIVKREAAVIHQEAKAILEEQKQKLIDQVQRVK